MSKVYIVVTEVVEFGSGITYHMDNKVFAI
jgi:hypothetical protein